MRKEVFSKDKHENYKQKNRGDAYGSEKNEWRCTYQKK